MDIDSVFSVVSEGKRVGRRADLWPTCDVTPQIRMIPTRFLLNRVKVVFASKNKKNCFQNGNN